MQHTPTTSQKKAIEAELGPLLVLAGPGSGKTFCLTQRVRWLIERHGVAPERIYAFTFTNKAADEIASRLDTLGDAARLVKRSTIHKFCVDVLRSYGTSANVAPTFGIADEDYQLSLLRQLGSSERFQKPLLQAFARHRLRGDSLDANDARRFEKYQQTLRERNMLDFDQLLLRAADVVQHAASAEALRTRWDAILVDEFQDLNPIQYAIVRTLALNTSNVFAVGDCDQSIYGWAGADITLFRSFVNDFGVASEPLRLRENHRTAKHIFAYAQAFADRFPMFPELGGRQTVEARHTSMFPVEAKCFENAEQEAAWLIDDIRLQRETEHLSWSDFGVLYRRHDIGNALEPAFLVAGIPCRLATGRAVAEDPVVAYVTACLGVMLRPDDDGLKERFLRIVLPRTLVAAARAEAERRSCSILDYLRERQNDKKDTATADKIKRARATLRSLGAHLRRHTELPSLLDELLSRRVGQYRTQLEERHTELQDPEVNTDAAALAFRLSSVLQRQATVILSPMGGTEIPIKGMLHAIGVRRVEIGTPIAGAEFFGDKDSPRAPLVHTLFKAAQILTARSFESTFREFTAIDIETTGLNWKRCNIVEIAAARVRNGRIVAEFHSLMKPTIPIEAGATAMHQITEGEVADAPPFVEVWRRFQDFCGDDVLVAHNGEEFDFPVIRRLAHGLPGAARMATYDSMPLAYEITPSSHQLKALAELYGIDPGNSHRAADDARTLALVFTRLSAEQVTRSRKSCCANLLDHLGVGLALSQPLPETGDTKVLLEIARPFALGVFSAALDYYDSMCRETGAGSRATVEQVIAALGGVQLMERIRRAKSAEERYPTSMQRLRALTQGTHGMPIAEQVETLVERVALSGRDADTQEGRVNLLTLHATKGLEFSRVYMVGAEDGQFSADNASREELEESRRVFYVGMTRARDRLVFTRALSRNGKPTGGSAYLDELGLAQQTAGVVIPTEGRNLQMAGADSSRAPTSADSSLRSAQGGALRSG